MKVSKFLSRNYMSYKLSVSGSIYAEPAETSVEVGTPILSEKFVLVSITYLLITVEQITLKFSGLTNNKH